MQHICVYDIRFSILTKMYKSLKKDGRISIQMGYGKAKKNSVGYYENDFNAIGSNGSKDTRIEDPNEIKKDLENMASNNLNTGFAQLVQVMITLIGFFSLLVNRKDSPH